MSWTEKGTRHPISIKGIDAGSGERLCRLVDRRGRVPLLLQVLDVLGQGQLPAVHAYGGVEGRGDLVGGGQRPLLGGGSVS